MFDRTSSGMEMLRYALSSRKILSEEALKHCSTFLISRLNEDGGFKGRSEKSDIYYTAFALAGLLVTDGEFDIKNVSAYVKTFEDLEKESFVHLCSLLKARLALLLLSLPGRDVLLAASSVSNLLATSGLFRKTSNKEILKALECFRTSDGGYSHVGKNADNCSAYGNFLAFQAYSDCGRKVPEPDTFLHSISTFESSDGAFSNIPGEASGSTNATAGLIVTLKHLGQEVPQSAVDFLMKACCYDGGFKANIIAPAPDLLSTATALYALRSAGIPLKDIRGNNLSFIESHWDDCGGFRGTVFDDLCDCEYTFYGLLALGCLAEAE